MSRFPRTSRRHARLPALVAGLTAVVVSPLALAGEALSFDEALQRARKYGPVAVESDGQLAVARTSDLWARVLPFGNPLIELTAGRQRFAESELDAKVYLPMEIFGQRSARISESERLIGWRGLANEEIRARLTGEVTSVWGTAVVSAERVAQVRIIAQEAQREADWVMARQALRAATTAERSFVEAEIARWFQVGSEADVAFGQALTRLAQLVALPEVALPASVKAQSPTFRFGSEQAVLAHVLEMAPSLRSLTAEAAFWRANAVRYQKERLAPVSVVVSGGRGDLGEPRVAGGLAWALPTFRKNQGEIGRAQAEAARADAVLAATRESLATRVRGDWRVLSTARVALASLETTGLPASERLVDAATESWRAGKSELVQVIIARRDLASARLRRLDLVETIWRIYGDIASLIGDLP